MPNQTARQQARRAALDAQTRMRQRRAEQERRRSALALTVVTALAERDALVAACETRAGAALQALIDEEGLSVREAIEWCGGTAQLRVREATRLRQVNDLNATDAGVDVDPTDPIRSGPGRPRARATSRRASPRPGSDGDRLMATTLDAAGLADLAAACASPEVVARWRAKLVTVEGSDCIWWTGAVSGRGHGRFWLSPGRVVVAHRFAYTLAHGINATAGIPVLGHRCDNPLCQRVGPGHLVPSSYEQNRREWAIRRRLSGSPLQDPRGSRLRARELRDLARQDPALVTLELARLRGILGEQLSLW